MKICLVSQEYPPERGGGIATQTFAKAEGLARRGHEIFVITRSRTLEHSVCRSANITELRIPCFAPGTVGLYSELADWVNYSTRLAATLDQLHSNEELDLVEFPEWACEGYAFLANRRNHKPVTIIQLHGPLVMFAHTMGWPQLDTDFYRTGTSMEGVCLRLADAVYSSSQCSIDWCAKHYGLSAGQVPVIHTGVDIARFRPLALPKPARPTILFVGRITRNKGIFELLDAAASLTGEFPDLQLRVIGGGEPQEVEHLRRLASKLSRAGLLELAGFIRNADLPEHFSQAHVFAAPSVYEGGPGFVYLEAMACGIPVIGCQGSGASEVIQHGYNGLLVPPGDSRALREAVRQLLSNPDATTRLGTQARSYVVTHCAQDKCLAQLEDFYKTVVNAHGAGGAEDNSEPAGKDKRTANLCRQPAIT